MSSWKRMQPRSNIPTEVRDELERHGETAVSAVLAHPFDVPTSPMFSLRHEHKEHALAWLREKREVADARNRFLRRLAIAGAIISALALTFAAASFFYAKRNFEANRPSVVLEFPHLNWSRGVKASISVRFQNVGTRPAVDVTATLGTTNSDATSVIQLAELGPIGNPLYADNRPLASNVDVDPDKLRDLLVVCMGYSDLDDRRFRELQVYSFVGWPPPDNVAGPLEFAGGTVSREVYQRMVKADVCTKLH